MVASACNPIKREANAGRQLLNQPGPHSEKLSQKIFLASFNKFCGAGILLGRQALHHLVTVSNLKQYNSDLEI